MGGLLIQTRTRVGFCYAEVLKHLKITHNVESSILPHFVTLPHQKVACEETNFIKFCESIVYSIFCECDKDKLLSVIQQPMFH